MSIHGMKPQFKDYQGYQEWRADWRGLYAHVSEDVRKSKLTIKFLQRTGQSSAAQQKEHHFKSISARKLLTVLEEAKIRWQNISNMRKGVLEQRKEYPLEVESKNIDFHFNKKSMEFEFVPMWVVKAKGKTYYVDHMECLTGFTTRENPDHPSTKGSLRVKRGTLSIDAEGNATIR